MKTLKEQRNSGLVKIIDMQNWQKRVLSTCWITYASFYLLRVNFSVAIPGILEEFNISKTAIGGILTASFIAYAAGQFINGQLGDKFSAKKLVGIGLLGSAVLNIIFGFTGNFLAGMILIWGLNGFFQSMGWAPTVRIVANWFPRNQRGKAAGILGSSYQIGNVASWLLAGFIVGVLGWRWAFWVPGVIIVFFIINWFLNIKEKAEDVGFEPVEIARKSNGLRDTMSTILKNKKIWIVALGLFGLNIVRYGFLDWAPTYFFEVQKAPISLATYKAIIFPLAGSLGALSAGWISDKFFQSKRAPMAIFMLSILILAIWFFPQIPTTSWVLSLMILGIIGFTTYGPHMLLVTAFPMDLGTKEMASSATGFIDGWGYIGAALTGVGTGYLLDHFGWDAAFYFWLFGAMITLILMLILWNFEKFKKLKFSK